MSPVRIVLTCEHGGNRIPAAYAAYFQSAGAVLDSHRGFDAGALAVAGAIGLAGGAFMMQRRGRKAA